MIALAPLPTPTPQMVAQVSCSAIGMKGKPPCPIGKAITIATSPPSAPATVRFTCAQLVESAGKPVGPISAWYGALMAESLHAHGFDVAWPHVPAAVIGAAITDWTGCFAPEAPAKK